MSPTEAIELIRKALHNALAFPPTESAREETKALLAALSVLEARILPEDPSPQIMQLLKDHRDGKLDNMRFYRAVLAALGRIGD